MPPCWTVWPHGSRPLAVLMSAESPNQTLCWFSGISIWLETMPNSTTRTACVKVVETRRKPSSRNSSRAPTCVCSRHHAAHCQGRFPQYLGGGSPHSSSMISTLSFFLCCSRRPRRLSIPADLGREQTMPGVCRRRDTKPSTMLLKVVVTSPRFDLYCCKAFLRFWKLSRNP